VSPELLGVLGILVLIGLLFAGVWIGIAMGVIGFLGILYLQGATAAFATLATVPYRNVAFYPITCLPLFILMGVIVANTGVSTDLFKCAHKWVGNVRGGLAIATVLACAGFAAVTGSSIAGAITMGKVAYPEMKRYNYDDSLANSVIASGGTLGILIPPSIGFVIYGIVTEESIGRLFMAGIFPGILLTLLFVISVMVITRINPSAGPAGPGSTLQEKITSAKGIWPIALLFLLVLGGIYVGIFTPTEAAAVGAFGAIIITIAARRLSTRVLVSSLLEAGETTGMMILIIIGAFVFLRFLTVSGVASSFAAFVSGLSLSKYLILLVVVVFYIIVGIFLEIMSSMVLTVPIIYPVMMALGFDPIWFGVIMVILMEMGLITPPVGLNVFALAGVTKSPLNTIFKGVWPFVLAMLLCVLILTLFPQIALFIPNSM
jgi:C4-dicarboxylate transporter DctM subunit